MIVTETKAVRMRCKLNGGAFTNIYVVTEEREVVVFKTKTTKGRERNMNPKEGIQVEANVVNNRKVDNRGRCGVNQASPLF